MRRETCRNSEKIPRELLDRLERAKKVTVLTGAGVSAESGIPTFREAHTGIWARFDPLQLASPEAFERDPATVWAWYVWRRELIAGSRPNAGHRALAEMAAQVPRFSLMTQNVDGFHALAGSRNVLELHGNIQRNICSRTGRTIDADWIESHPDEDPPPSPHHPRGLSRPDVVWFGEALDADTLDAATAAARACEVMLVVGTSGAVHPAASLPVIAAEAGARIIDINPQRNELTSIAEWHLVGPSATWLPALRDALRERSS